MKNNRELYLVINRWDDEFAEYGKFLSEAEGDICCITTEPGLPRVVADQHRSVKILPDLDYGTVLSAATQLRKQHGPFSRIAGISEYDLATAARLREHFDVPGDTVEFVSRFKDKTQMKDLIARAELPVPRYLDLARDMQAEDVLAQLRLPLILKPRIGAGSDGVVKVSDVDELRAAMAGCDLQHYECEEYVEGDIFHVDGVVRAGSPRFVSISGYVNTCLDFALGKPLGSVLLAPGAARDKIGVFAAGCLAALGVADGVFHLELIKTPAGRLVFLEIGLRCGGGEIPFIHRDLFSVNLPAESFRAALSLPSLLPSVPDYGPVHGGFVMVPEPRPFPSRVVARTSLLGSVPGLYREILPAIGEIFDGHGDYEHIGGRFHLKGQSECQVRKDIWAIFKGYELEVERPTEGQ